MEVLTDQDLSSRLFTFTMGRGLTLTSARALVRAHIDGPGSQPTDALDHTSCVSRALMPTLAVQPLHHRQRDWAVSMFSHMQQYVDIAEEPPHLGLPIPVFLTPRRRSKKLAITLIKDIVVFDECSNACFPLRALCTKGCDFGGRLNYMKYSKNRKRATDNQRTGQRSACFLSRDR